MRILFMSRFLIYYMSGMNTDYKQRSYFNLNLSTCNKKTIAHVKI